MLGSDEVSSWCHVTHQGVRSLPSKNITCMWAGRLFKLNRKVSVCLSLLPYQVGVCLLWCSPLVFPRPLKCVPTSVQVLHGRNLHNQSVQWGVKYCCPFGAARIVFCSGPGRFRHGKKCPDVQECVCVYICPVMIDFAQIPKPAFFSEHCRVL